ncbi:MAG: GerW family sporulation protein [Clostridia bacterium]|nr:GerW family sporulation protein [Clostridia bacterium]
MNEIPLKQVIDASLTNLKSFLNADSVVGTPITLPGDVVVIPVSKVSCGFTSGGVDFDSKTNPRREVPHFGGGNGAGVSVTPVTFLVISEGNVRLMNVNGTGVSSDSAIVNTISDLVDKSPAIFGKLKSFFKKGDKKTEENAKEKTEDKKEDRTEGKSEDEILADLDKV